VTDQVFATLKKALHGRMQRLIKDTSRVIEQKRYDVPKKGFKIFN